MPVPSRMALGPAAPEDPRMPDRNARPTYWDYLRIEELLALQGGLAGDEGALSNDEVRFVVIHQIDELWFKLVLRELTAARDLFKLPHVPETSLSAASLALHRVALTFQLAAQHFALMETMRTQDYLAFRDKLSPASGFQSAQMREIEILLGLGMDERIRFGKEGSYLDALRGAGGRRSPAQVRVERRLADCPSLKAAVHGWLERAPIDGSLPGTPGDAAAVQRFVDAFLAGHRRGIEEQMRDVLAAQASNAEDRARLEQRYRSDLESARAYLNPDDKATQRLRAAILFIDSNRQLPLLSWPAEIIDRLIALEQSMLVFRQRHARMVERVIGRRVGTGGSDGVDYLDQTALKYRVFHEVWTARTLLLRRELTPKVGDPGFYGLRHE
jgi:tryptophan 2,3-dioxygenase